MTARQKIMLELFGDRIAPNSSLVRDNFTKWFGNSKVVGPGGEPMIVYHGTSDEIVSFRAGVNWFTNSINSAEGYAQDRTRARLIASIFDTSMQPGSACVIPVYLSIKNPKVFDLKGANYNPKWIDAQANTARSDGFDGVIFLNSIDITSFSKAIPADVVASFSPNQIKSAFGNSGLFDPDSSTLTDTHACELESRSMIPQERLRA